MGMAANELGVDVFENVADVKVLFLASNLCMQVDLEQQVAEFFGQLLHIVLLQGLHDLVGLLNDIVGQGLVRLLAIPGTTVGFTTQAHGDVA